MSATSGWARRLATLAVLAGLGTTILVAAGCRPGGTESTAAPAPKASPARLGQGPASAPMTLPLPPSTNSAAVAVSVDAARLTEGEIDAQISRFVQRAGAHMPPEQFEKIRPQVRQQEIERFVIRNLLQNEAIRRQIAVSSDDVSNALAEIQTSLPPGLTFQDALAKDGISELEFRSNLTSHLTVKKLVDQQLTNAPAPSDAEVTAFYATEKERFAEGETVRARHILVKVDEGADDKTRAEKKAKAEGILKQLQEGADFAKLAKESSECPSGQRGGELPPFQHGEMVKAFDDAAFALPTNTLSPLVETEFGYHVIQVLDHNTARTNSLEDVKEKIVSHLKERKQQKTMETFIDGLRAKAKITYADGPAGGTPMMPMVPAE